MARGGRDRGRRKQYTENYLLPGDIKYTSGTKRQVHLAYLYAKQDGRCAICRQEMPSPVIDHDHETGMVRGLLCRACNLLLGAARDDVVVLRRAVGYLAVFRDRDKLRSESGELMAPAPLPGEGMQTSPQA